MTSVRHNLPTNPLRVAAVQMESKASDKVSNLAKIEAFVQEAANQSVKLIIFPECCITGYWFIRKLNAEQLRDLAEPIFTGSSSQHIIRLAQKYDLGIGAGLIEDNGSGHFYNSYIVVFPNGEMYCHRKLHAFEHPLIRSGVEYTVFDSPYGWRIGILICYDNNLIENVRITALMGADLLLAPHQTGGCRTKNPHLMGVIDRRLWDERYVNPEAIEREFRGEKGRAWIMRWFPSRAHDNGIFVIFANGVGIDDDEIRTGNAMILDPYGRILAETCIADDAMVITELDNKLCERAIGRNWIAARRPELYGILTIRTGLERDVQELKFEE